MGEGDRRVGPSQAHEGQQRRSGEEFVLLLPQTRRDEAVRFAEELRQRVETDPSSTTAKA